MAKALTAAAIAKLQPDPAKRLEVGDALSPGLRLSITPAGSKSFVFRFKLHGKAGKLTLGSVEHLTLAEARERAREAAVSVSRGENPAALKQATKEALREAADADRDFWPSVLNEFEQRHASKLRSGTEMMRFLRRETSGWDRKEIGEISRKNIIRLLDDIVDSGRPSTAIKIKLHLSKVFAWAVGRDLLPGSPMLGVSMPAVEVARDRVLTDTELRAIWQAVGRLSPPFRQYVQVLTLTAQRRDEVASLPWAELHGLGNAASEWRLPASRAKNKRSSIVPLSTAVAEIVATIPRVTNPDGEDWVFTTNGRSPISGFSALKSKIDAQIALLLNEGATGEETSKAFDWRFHDLRRTAATRMADIGVAPHVIEVALNHVGGSKAGVAGTYNRSRYDDQLRDGLERWSAYVERLIEKAAVPPSSE